jgi:hypothetical protein
MEIEIIAYTIQTVLDLRRFTLQHFAHMDSYNGVHTLGLSPEYKLAYLKSHLSKYNFSLNPHKMPFSPPQCPGIT